MRIKHDLNLFYDETVKDAQLCALTQFCSFTILQVFSGIFPSQNSNIQQKVCKANSF